MTHSFDVELAKKYGIIKAILLEYLCFWQSTNEANNKHFYDGRYWVYNSIKAFHKLFPYLTEKQIRYALNSMIKDGLIYIGNYNKNKYDRTLWYSVSDNIYHEVTKAIRENASDRKEKCKCQNGKMEVPKSQNGDAQKGEPIPSSNTSSNTPNSSEFTASNECNSKTNKKENIKSSLNTSFSNNKKNNINNNLYSSKHSNKRSEFISGKEKQQPPPPYKPPNNLSPENIKKQRVLFEKFWLNYPRKVNKVGALAEWLKINPDEALFNQIMEGLENYIKYEWPNAELNFIVYPSTFLAQRRWEDKPGVQYPKPKQVWTTTEEKKDGLYDSYIKPLISGILKDV